VRISAAVCRAVDRPPALEDLALDAPRDDEVLVRIVAAGICHTDLFAPARFPLPAVFGHEGAGIVERVGARVSKVRPGDRVALTFGSCGRCVRCTLGDVAYCEHGHHLQFDGARPDGSTTLRDAQGGTVHGSFFQQSSFATWALAGERNVVRVPDALPLERAAPLGCGVQTGAGAVLNTLGARPGSSIAIFGAGSVGLSAVMAARIAGCSTIVAVDVIDARLALARELGATHTVDARGGGAAARVREITGGRGADYTFETAGQVQSFNDAIDCLARKGCCAIATIPRLGEPFEWSPLGLLLRAGRLVVCIEGDSVPDRFIPQLAAWHLEGRLPYDRFCQQYSFSDFPRAWADADAARAIKPILRME
jgi:aryl-alcohol dehydrogenase